MISLYVLSGFLGSGKTTLMQNLTNLFHDKKCGIIINEFGKTSIDGAVINGGDRIVELNNGSVFCKCMSGTFIEEILGFKEYPIELLFVEASGLADPANIDEIISIVQNKAPGAFDFKGVICLVDPLGFLKISGVLKSSVNQVAFADLVLINKTDLADSEQINKVAEKIKRINSDALILKTSFAKVDRDTVEGVIHNNRVPGETTNTPTGRAVVYEVTYDGEIAKAELAEFLNGLKSSAHRIKGFAMTEDGYLLINCVGDSISLSKTDILRSETQLVIISGGELEFGTVSALWAKLTGKRGHISEC